MRRKKYIAWTLALALLVSTLPALAAGTDTRSSVAAGGMSHSLAIQEDGTVLAWGANGSGQLGQPADVTASKTPVEVQGVSAVSVAAGADFSVALKYDGTVYTWGAGVSWEPWNAGISGVTAIAAGQTHILALKSDGTVWQWQPGQTPTQVPGLSRIAAISAGGGHSLALTTSGEVYAWGNNNKGQLGDGTTTSRTAPVRVPGLVDIVDVAAGYNHSLAVAYDGTVYAWGSDSYGELGSSEKNTGPTAVEGIKGAVQVAAGNESSMALTDKGVVYTWGYGEYGQLGNGKFSNAQIKPVTISTSQKMAFITAGVYHDLAVTEGGSLYAWGRNKDGQLGSNQSDNADTPKSVSGSVSVGSSYLVNSTESVSAWAKPEVDQLYDTELVPPMLWGSYQSNITRGEFAHLLVSMYESVKKTTAPASSSKLEKFTDIDGHMLAEDMKKAYLLGIINGTSETTFSPDRTITRQEAAKMLCLFVGKVRDVKISDQMQNLAFYYDAMDIAEWAVPYVYYAYQNNIMKGNDKGGFAPQASLTREESLVIMARLVEAYGWAE